MDVVAVLVVVGVVVSLSLSLSLSVSLSLSLLSSLTFTLILLLLLDLLLLFLFSIRPELRSMAPSKYRYTLLAGPRSRLQMQTKNKLLSQKALIVPKMDLAKISYDH